MSVSPLKLNNIISRLEQLSWLVSWPLFSFVAGTLTTLAFAPFELSWLVFVTLALAFYYWHRLPLKQAVISGWLFGLGLQCTGVSWIYFSLHVHGSAPAFFAALTIFLLSACLALFTAMAVYIVNRYLLDKQILRLLVFYPASWVLLEWFQGYALTGFAWMQLGYTQIDLPLSGFAPVFGNHAVSGFIAVSAGALVFLYKQGKNLHGEGINYKLLISVLIPVVVLWPAGYLLKSINWTEIDGEPIKVSVIQGNIAQKDKWKPYMKQPTLDIYRNLSLAQKDVDLIVWPETAIPDYRYRAAHYIEKLRHELAAPDTDLLLGIFVKDENQRVLNSVININGGIYNKRHLVPLGEYIPLRFLVEFFNRFVRIPMSDIISGDEDQPLLIGGGVPLGISICFEDAFSREVNRDLPEAKLLVNVSNDAWFEDSIQPHQHHAIARMRALETGRYMIRSTNTGITSFIDPHGEVIKQLPQFEVGVLNGEVLPYVGSTPFVRWGNWLVVGLCSLLLLGFAVFKKSKAKN